MRKSEVQVKHDKQNELLNKSFDEVFEDSTAISAESYHDAIELVDAVDIDLNNKLDLDDGDMDV